MLAKCSSVDIAVMASIQMTDDSQRTHTRKMDLHTGYLSACERTFRTRNIVRGVQIALKYERMRSDGHSQPRVDTGLIEPEHKRP